MLRNLTFASMVYFALSLVGEPAQAIYGGVDLPEGNYPEIVQVFTVPKNGKINLDDLDSYCTGAVIFDNLVVTAGHCVSDLKKNPELRLMVGQRNAQGQFALYNPKEVKTKFVDEETPDMYPEHGSSPGYVEGCYQGPVPLISTPEPDLALIYFPVKTFKKWFELDTLPVNPGERVLMYGFGSRTDTSISGGLSLSLRPQGLAKSDSVVWDRVNTQRFSVINQVHQNYADSGDSGGPVVRGGKLIGILATRENKCETPGGEDYAIVNTITRAAEIVKLMSR